MCESVWVRACLFAVRSLWASPARGSLSLSVSLCLSLCSDYHVLHTCSLSSVNQPLCCSILLQSPFYPRCKHWPCLPPHLGTNKPNPHIQCVYTPMKNYVHTHSWEILQCMHDKNVTETAGTQWSEFILYLYPYRLWLIPVTRRIMGRSGELVVPPLISTVCGHSWPEKTPKAGRDDCCSGNSCLKFPLAVPINKAQI